MDQVSHGSLGDTDYGVSALGRICMVWYTRMRNGDVIRIHARINESRRVQNRGRQRGTSAHKSK